MGPHSMGKIVMVCVSRAQGFNYFHLMDTVMSQGGNLMFQYGCWVSRLVTDSEEARKCHGRVPWSRRNFITLYTPLCLSTSSSSRLQLVNDNVSQPLSSASLNTLV